MSVNNLMAYYAMNPNFYLSFEEIEEAQESGMDSEDRDGVKFVDMSQYSGKTPEDIVIDRERWNNLREETKQLLELLVDCPEEIMKEMLEGSFQKATFLKAKHVARWLRRSWGEREIVAVMMEEVREFLRANND